MWSYVLCEKHILEEQSSCINYSYARMVIDAIVFGNTLKQQPVSKTNKFET
jgi:hypothetical protein